MKTFAAFVLVLACLVPAAHADTTQTWTVTAQCDPNINPLLPCVNPAILNATITTQLEFGTWDCPFCPIGFLVGATVPAVIGMSGTFDGMAITQFTPGSWIYENDPLDGFPEIAFTAGGHLYGISYDAFFTFGDGTGLVEDMDWSAPDPPMNAPEPGTLALLASGLLALYWLGGLDFLLRRGQTRRLNALLK